jgi:hypothetical protein
MASGGRGEEGRVLRKEQICEEVVIFDHVSKERGGVVAVRRGRSEGGRGGGREPQVAIFDL